MSSDQFTRHRPAWLFPIMLSSLAGLIYCSWPLGYWLNPRGSSGSLASELGALNQPYNWLFIGLDVLSGLLVLGAVILMWNWRRTHNRRWLLIALINFALFGVFTAVAALSPLDCDSSLQADCLQATHNPLLIYHGIFSILGPLCLLFSALIVWWHGRKRNGSALLAILIGGWSLFGLISLILAFLPGHSDSLIQRYYIVLCSAWTVVLPYVIWRTLMLKQSNRNR